MTPRATRYPGAIWTPAGTDQGAMDDIRGVSLHEAVTRARSLKGWVDTSDACHLFVAEDGTAEQYKEFGRIAYGVAAGNSTMLTVETWDGLDPNGERNTAGLGPNETRWTPAQCERIADFLAWANLNLGVPLRLMRSSARSEHGIAPHRWGVDPWRIQRGGGEVWTKHPGKPCPGDLRIAQIPSIIDRAVNFAAIEGYRPIQPGPVASTPPATFTPTGGQPAGDDMPLTPNDLEAIKNAVRAVVNEDESNSDSLKAAIVAMVNKSARESGFAWSADVGRIAAAVGTNLAGHIISAVQAQLAEVPAERIEAAVRAGIGQAFAAAGEAAAQ